MQQFQTNVFGVLNVTNAVLPHMRERRSGTVVIVGSRTGWHAAVPVSHTHDSQYPEKVADHSLPSAGRILRRLESRRTW